MKAQASRFFHLLFFTLVFLILLLLVRVSSAQELLPFPFGRTYFPYMVRQPLAVTLTPTPTPTSTPTPTATPVPPRVKILSGSYSYTSMDSLHIIGEVENQTGNDVSDLWIESSLKNSKNKVLASQLDMIYLSYLPAGKRTCFHIIYINPPDDWASYSLSGLQYTNATGIRPDLAITSWNDTYNAISGEYTIRGYVRNNGNSTVYLVKVIGAIFDGNDKIRGCAYDYISAYSTYLEPDKNSSFEIDFYGRDFADVDGDKDIRQPDGYIP
jgi:hypothetical protein